MRGNAVHIIREAMNLGIYCRPVPGTNGPLFEGEALKPTRDSFEKIEIFSNKYAGMFVVDPTCLLVDWELITAEKLAEEYEAYVKSFEGSPF